MNTKLAAGATVVALGGLTAAAIAGQPGNTDAKTTAAAPVQVRTVTIRKTVRVVRHEKPRHKRIRPAAPAVTPRPASAASPPTAVASASTGSAPAHSAPAPRPVVPRYTPSVRTPSTTTHHPVTTRTSGGGGKPGRGEGERDDRHESEGGDD